MLIGGHIMNLNFINPKPTCPIHKNKNIIKSSYNGKTEEGYVFYPNNKLELIHCKICDQYYFNNYKYPYSLKANGLFAKKVFYNNSTIIINNYKLYIYEGNIEKPCRCKNRGYYKVNGLIIVENKNVTIRCHVCKSCGEIFVNNDEYKKKYNEITEAHNKNLVMINFKYMKPKNIISIHPHNYTFEEITDKLLFNNAFLRNFNIKFTPVASIRVKENGVLLIYGVIKVKDSYYNMRREFRAHYLLLSGSSEWHCLLSAITTGDRKTSYKRNGKRIDCEIIQFYLFDESAIAQYYRLQKVNKIEDFTKNKNELLNIQVYQYRCPCERAGHKIELVEIKVKNVLEKDVYIKCFYCNDCSKYYIQQALLDYYLRQNRGLICLIRGYKDKKGRINKGFRYIDDFDYTELSSQSKLFLYGYKVGPKDMTSRLRHQIINSIITYKLMTPYEIISQININMNLHKKSELAIKRWKEDIEFIDTTYRGNKSIEGNVSLFYT